jgi:CRP-like cAMP-binding protein
MPTIDVLRKFLKKFPPNATIFEEGDTSTELYILRAGSVAIIKGGKEVAQISERGAYIGEMSPILGDPRSATMTTRTSCQFYVIPGDVLPKMIASAPGLAMKLLAAIAVRLKTTTEDLATTRSTTEITKEKIDEVIDDYNDLAILLRQVAKYIGSPLLKAISEYSEAKRDVPEAIKTNYDRALMRDILLDFIDGIYDGR